jgi:phage gp36-like protein
MSAYCSKSDIEARFGVSNVLLWATLSTDDNSVVQAARIATAIAVATDELDEVLRCVSAIESKLPITTVPDSVKDKVAIRAGYWLYSFRATDDYSEKDNSFPELLYKQYRIWISEVRAGTRKLNIT